MSEARADLLALALALALALVEEEGANADEVVAIAARIVAMAENFILLCL